MMSKYYTPDITEFKVGFEYEVFQVGEVHDVDVMYFMPHDVEDKWHKYKFPDPFYGYRADILLSKSIIRVKYLDKQDIESLGFEISSQKNLRFKKEISDGFYELNFYPVNNEIAITRHWVKCDKCGDIMEFKMFNGKVKNISVLKDVLNMIGVTYKNN